VTHTTQTHTPAIRGAKVYDVAGQARGVGAYKIPEEGGIEAEKGGIHPEPRRPFYTETAQEIPDLRHRAPDDATLVRHRGPRGHEQGKKRQSKAQSLVHHGDLLFALNRLRANTSQ